MTASLRRRRRLTSVVALTGASAVLLAACSSGSKSPAGAAGSSTASTSTSPAASGSAPPSASSGAATGPGSSSFAYLGQVENTTIAATLKTLSTGACQAANSAAPVSFQTTPATQYDQKAQLLAGQNALPNMMMAAQTPSLNTQFIKAGKLEDLSTVLGSSLNDDVLPAAASTIKALYGSQDLYALPTEFNIEGIWYNKKLFSANGVTVPATWDDLVAAAAKLKKAGVQPFAVDGKDGWPITRLVGDYIFRDLGGDALQKVADGQAKLTDPDYVKAADAVAALGKAGYFGPSVGSIDYNTAMNEFLTGKAAMFYMGSWALSNFEDAKQNTIGQDTIGLMPFPAVTGGKGSIDDVPANVGVPVVFSSHGYGTNIEAWIKCIAQNYGDAVLKNSGVISGFKINNPPSTLPPLTQQTQATMSKATNSVLWFEALFSAKATTVSQTNAAPLATGSVSGQQFMSLVQAANTSG